MKMEKISVMFVLPSFAGGGAERVALTLLRHLDRARFSPSLLVFDAHGPLAGMVPEGLPITDLRRPRLRAAAPAMVAAIRRARPDVVFSTLGYVNLALLALRPFLPRSLRLIVREANMPSLSLPMTAYPRLFRFAYRVLYPRADRVVCTSTKMHDELAKDFGVPVSHLVMMPNPVDVDAIRAAASPARRQAGEGTRLVAAGRLTYQKGFDRLLEMLPELDSSTHLTILGDGPQKEFLAQKAGDLGVAARVTFGGFCDNPWGYYAGADCVVLPSRWEGQPNVALEALACGTPVIATPEAGGIADIAALSDPGAVTIAESGQPFIDVLRTTPSNVQLDSGVRPCLLPEEFRVDMVSELFMHTLDKACHAASMEAAK